MVSNVKINELAILWCFSICIVPFNIFMYTITYKNITSIYLGKNNKETISQNIRMNSLVQSQPEYTSHNVNSNVVFIK